MRDVNMLQLAILMCAKASLSLRSRYLLLDEERVRRLSAVPALPDGPHHERLAAAAIASSKHALHLYDTNLASPCHIRYVHPILFKR